MRIKKKKYYIGILCGVVLILGGVWQALMTPKEQEQYPAVGDFVDVGAYQAHYYTKGNGDVAYVFITGSGTPCAYTDFYQLQDWLSTKGQTVSFDHAGGGWSTKAKKERTIHHLVNELTEIIDAAAPEKPVILICHSLGSLEAIGYTQAHPDKVKAIIFLDAGSPEFYKNDSEVRAVFLNRSSALLRSIGWNRGLGELGMLLPLYGESVRNKNISIEVKQLDKAMYYRYTGNPESLDSIRQMNENAEVVLNGTRLGDIPILVLSSDQDQAWDEAQNQLSAWSNQSEQIMIAGAEHYIYWSNYQEVCSKIETFLQTLE